MHGNAELSAIELLAALEQRSRESAFGLPQQVEGEATWDGLGFRLGDLLLTAPFGEVVEVLESASITPVPRSKEWVLGLANVRGKLLPIMDLRGFLGFPARRGAGVRTLIVEDHDVSVGLVVDEVLGVKHFLPDERIAHPVTADESISPFIRGGFRQRGEIWGIFSFHELLETPAFMQVAA